MKSHSSMALQWRQEHDEGVARRCSDGAIQTKPFFPLYFSSFSASSQEEKGQVQRRWRGRGLLSPLCSGSRRKREASSSFLFLFRLIGERDFGRLRHKGSDAVIWRK
ncbi:hypothetical protein V8G54_010420 [Vigna mungo]|uniref:Uncharacterized protein n=1 Tax=Vigna mungo TaxID=3915 RepID=A0AAQ3P020_VIGMU